MYLVLYMFCDLHCLSLSASGVKLIPFLFFPFSKYDLFLCHTTLAATVLLSAWTLMWVSNKWRLYTVCIYVHARSEWYQLLLYIHGVA